MATTFPPQSLSASALAILAISAPGPSRDLGPLTKELGMKLVSGARFPDEPPGDHHTLMSQEMVNNTTVHAILDLLHRRQDDPAVKEILAALRRRTK